jgi:hypothetical protein
MDETIDVDGRICKRKSYPSPTTEMNGGWLNEEEKRWTKRRHQLAIWLLLHIITYCIYVARICLSVIGMHAIAWIDDDGTC